MRGILQETAPSRLPLCNQIQTFDSRSFLKRYSSYPKLKLPAPSEGEKDTSGGTLHQGAKGVVIKGHGSNRMILSPPLREDDRDGHYVFSLRDNLISIIKVNQKRKKPESVKSGSDSDDLSSDSEEDEEEEAKVDEEELSRWKKRSIFFRLSYWQDLPVRHNLDVMHVERNVAASIVSTLLDCVKSKDGLNAHKDLEVLAIRKDLHPQTKGKRTYLLAALWSLSKTEKKIFCKRLFDFKGPDGYCSDIARGVSLEECKKKKSGRQSKKESPKKCNDDEVKYVGTIEPTDVEQTDQVPAENIEEAVNNVETEKEAEVQAAVEQGDKDPDVEDPEGELELSGDEDVVQPKTKRQRGPTRMKDIAKDPNARVSVEYTMMGEPIGKGSVKLASYAGALVGEHARFELDEEFQKVAVLKQMGCLWRSWKSRQVTKFREAKTNQQRMNLRPKNVSPFEWRKFVKSKTSPEFKKTGSADPAEVTRLKKKAAEIVSNGPQSNGTNEAQDSLSQLLGPDNPDRLRAMGRNMNKTKLACFQVKNKFNMEIMEKAVGQMIAWPVAMCVNLEEELNPEDIAPLGPRPTSGNKCKLLDLSSNDVVVAEGPKGSESAGKIAKSLGEKQPAVVPKSPVKKSQLASQSPLRRSPRQKASKGLKANQKCKLMDISGKKRVVGAGRVHSIDQDQKMHHVRLGENAARVWIDVVNVDDAAVWRPTDESIVVYVLALSILLFFGLPNTTLARVQYGSPVSRKEIGRGVWDQKVFNEIKIAVGGSDSVRAHSKDHKSNPNG
ncbi:hypothetical protein ISN44_As01g035320 [Arabidopsis suecica]|uniref:Uncharacterized protein n=1 Tax=Arabidopsis suecica TaxID=45249 RepID=A0A8T2HAN6_ARASU|nr:hypothetical protein ISN44_As01g035320 [Arabidopsis suecica]